MGMRMMETLTFRFEGDGAVPNSVLPLVVYRGVVPADAGAIERVFAGNGWPPAWRNGVHPFHHFHSVAHEVLGVARGSVSVLFGGEKGQVLTVAAGDVVVIPAGVGHCNVGQSGDLLIVGAYPDTGPSPDTRRGRAGEYAEVVEAVERVPLPGADPVVGGVLSAWW
jgi:uncharacterized protein YjlB